MTVETIDVTPTLRVRIEIDMAPVNPRTDYDCFGKIAYLNTGRLHLGDLPCSEFRLDQIGHGISTGELIGLPVYAYVHSGVVLRAAEANPFHCKWDSGQSGFVFVDVQKALQEFNAQTLTPEVKLRALTLLQAEVDTFSSYLSGEVYGYVIERLELDDEGEVRGIVELDSCWGFVGDVSYACQEGLAAAEHFKQLAGAH